MRIALFSDVHANLPALEAVLADIDRRRPDFVLCLGDLVGYAPWPNEVTSLIRQGRIPAIAGNYDVGVGRASDDCGCAYTSDHDKALGAASIAYTNEVVTDETRAYLAALPAHIRLDWPETRLLFVHGSPRRVNEYLYEDRSDESLLRLMTDVDVLAFGHTHKPWLRRLAGGRLAVNIGSVGKPKDGDPRACYAMLERAADWQVEFIRVPYDVEAAARAIEASPLPDAFAERLRRAY